MVQFSVNEQRCVRCGLCVQDCVMRVLHQEAGAPPWMPPEKEANCIACQHCLAICPTGAVSIMGRNPDASLPIFPEALPRLEQMTRLVRSRRSIRQYRDESVDPALLRELLATLGNVPTGINRHELTFRVIDDKAVMQRLRQETLTALRAAAEAGQVPERFAYLQNAVSAWFEDGADVIFRSAPHALIVSAPPDAPCPQEDVALTLAYFELLAQSAGLGTVWWGMLRLVTLVLPELKARLGIPADHHFYGMLFGYPTVRYARTVQRDDAAVVQRVTL